MSDISLNLLTVEDIELVRNWRNSDEVSPYMYDDSFISEEQQVNWFKKIKKEKSSLYWIIQFGGKKVGLAYITGIDKTLNSCYWAFYLGDNSVRGMGIGAKTEFNVLEYTFNVLKLNKLRCEVIVSNDKVIKMHEKFGFRREAYYREHCEKNNKKIDAVGLAILRNEWILLSQDMKNKIYKK
jgi:UDP-4-amino-4,6-dideoxy-N-acetyl-beta-L-altrosamine N-acetyltransferase